MRLSQELVDRNVHVKSKTGGPNFFSLRLVDRKRMYLSPRNGGLEMYVNVPTLRNGGQEIVYSSCPQDRWIGNVCTCTRTGRLEMYVLVFMMTGKLEVYLPIPKTAGWKCMYLFQRLVDWKYDWTDDVCTCPKDR
jgi:hypothetical protein